MSLSPIGRSAPKGTLSAVTPVNIVLLGLHGAMVAYGFDDCEGDLLARVRGIAGPKMVIGAELDPHTHLMSPLQMHLALPS